MLILLLSATSRDLNAQTPTVVKDDVYLLFCNSFLNNGRPISMFLACKDLSPLIERDILVSEDAFICDLLTNSVYVYEMFYSLTDAIKWNGLKRQQDKDALLRSLYKKQMNLNDFFSKDITVKLSDNKKFHIRILKLTGEFWQDKNVPWSSLTNGAGRFEVSKECYAKDHQYQIKDILSVSKLSKQELKDITR